MYCVIKMLKDVGMTVLKTLETRVLYADKGKDIWHEKQGAVCMKQRQTSNNNNMRNSSLHIFIIGLHM